MSLTIDHFDALTKKGLKIIPLWENSKRPIGKRWNIDWDRDRAREKLEQLPDSNIGLLLGDVIDVEGDSEEANDTIKRLVGDYPHPSYTSVRSIHHLFQTPDPELRIFKVGEIEFRGHGHQSVLPPSSHYGFSYKWQRNWKFPVPEMPESLYIFYLKHREGRKVLIKPGHRKVWCAGCGKEHFLHKKRWKLEREVFELLGSKWLCHFCRSLDIRPACRMIRRGIRGHIVRMNALQQF